MSRLFGLIVSIGEVYIVARKFDKKDTTKARDCPDRF